MTSQERRLSGSAPVSGVSKPHILVVDDDPSIIKLIKTYLSREGYTVSCVSTVASMRTTAEKAKIDLILLDVGLPDEDGWSALRWVRGRGAVPVIMLTGKGDTVDKVIGLELGADDYVAKPFDLRELLARMRSVLRRAEKQADAVADPVLDDMLVFGDWTVDLASQQLKDKDGRPVHLTQAEYRIVVLLAQNPRKVVTRDQLMDAMAGREWEPYDRSIDVHISNLRRKLDQDAKAPSLIRTVRGSGYMLVPRRS